jgi:hypothetical protein
MPDQGNQKRLADDRLETRLRPIAGEVGLKL